jgi:hypothetical protein
LNHLGLANIQQPGLFFNRHALGRSTRVADEHRQLLVRGGKHHVHQFIFVLRRHANDVRHAPQVGDVEQPVMSRSIVRR